MSHEKIKTKERLREITEKETHYTSYWGSPDVGRSVGSEQSIGVRKTDRHIGLQAVFKKSRKIRVAGG
jgi:hypothetical protein